MANPRINLVLVLVALAIAGAGCVGFFVPVSIPFRVRSTDWGVLHFYDGRMRIFWIQSRTDPIVVENFAIGPNLRVVSPFAAMPALPPETPGPEPPQISPPATLMIGTQRTVRDFGGRWHWAPIQTSPAGVPVQFNYIRVPAWLPVVALLIMPMRGIVRGPWLQRWRRRRNRCLHCGYSLEHLPKPRCPECGTPTDKTPA